MAGKKDEEKTGKEVAKKEQTAIAPLTRYEIPVEDIIKNFEAYRQLVANLIKDEDHVFFVTYMVTKQGKLKQKMESFTNKAAAENRVKVLKEKGFKPNLVPRMLKSGVEKLFKAMNMIQRNKFFPRWIKDECADNTSEFLTQTAAGKKPILWVKRVLGIFEAICDEEGKFVRHAQTGQILMVERERSEAWASTLEKRGFAHLPHDVIALAETRCFNRTVMRMLGMGQVTAEEIGSMGPASGSPVVIEADAYIVEDTEEEAPVEEIPPVEKADPQKEGKKPSEMAQEPKEAEKQEDTPEEAAKEQEAPKAEQEAPKEEAEEDDPKLRVKVFTDACKGKGFGSDRKVMGKLKEAIFAEAKLDASKLITQVAKEEFDTVVKRLHQYNRETFLLRYMASRGVKLNDKEFEVWKAEALKVIEAESFDAMTLPQFKKALDVAESTEPT
jgi:hypothetical protein